MAPFRRALLAALLAAAPVGARADVALLVPTRDNSIYEDGGILSNGAGQRLFSGVTKNDDIIRALLAFDVAGSVPAGSTVVSATLTLNVSQEPMGNGSAHSFALHRMTSDWGEGTSDAGDFGGAGTLATEDDATWLHAFYDTVTWTTDGGDFVAASSASQSTGPGLGTLSLGGAGLAADVQAWIDDPGSDFGWILRGDETSTGTARRFDSREIATPSLRPQLEIEFSPPNIPTLGSAGLLCMALGIGVVGLVVLRSRGRVRGV